MKKTYQMSWSKSYRVSGIKNIKAASDKEALNKLDLIIGDLKGSMQYHPENNLIEVVSIETSQVS
jgi:hypothetical protein